MFGDVAELYERVRPSYPEALVDDVVELSGVAQSGGRALEVGAGTGKATRLFAARGVRVHAIEPSAGMAAVVRETCAGYEGVTVQETDFERFAPGAGRFRLLFSAQAWHWVSPEVRYVRAREALEPGGLLALFWNRPRWEATPLRARADRGLRPRRAAWAVDGEPDPMHPVAETGHDPDGWLREMARVEGFDEPQTRLYGWSSTYSTDDYLDAAADPLRPHRQAGARAARDRRRGRQGDRPQRRIDPPRDRAMLVPGDRGDVAAPDRAGKARAQGAASASTWRSLGSCSWTDRTLVQDADWYPKKTMSAEERLRYYAAQFPLTEIDSTYYAPPAEQQARLWAERTPDGFRFDVKAYSLLTGHPTRPNSLWRDLREQLPPEIAEKRNIYASHLGAGRAR